MNWNINTAGVTVFFLLTLAYFGLTRGRLQPGAGRYGAGLLIGLLVQLLPLHTGGFPAHMLGHVALLLLAAPLLVLGFPKARNQAVVRRINGISGFLQYRPWVGWLTGLGVMWFWHVPAVFNAAFSPDKAGQFGLSLLHVSSLVLAGMAFAWPVLGPQKQYRINPLLGVIYLATACAGCSLLGLFITFAPAGLYAYTHVVERAGFIETLCGNWGTEQASAQQLAGLIMWVPGCFIYLTGAMYLLRSWLLDKETGLPQPGLTLNQTNA